MLKHISSVCVLVLTSLAEGCYVRPGFENDPRASRQLTAEQARLALIDMVEKTDTFELKVSLEHLRADPAVQRENGMVEIGTWRCNLQTRTFDGGVTTNKVFAHFQGEFSVTQEGKWRAEITDEQHN
jgi:hypothetical protein